MPSKTTKKAVKTAAKKTQPKAAKTAPKKTSAPANAPAKRAVKKAPAVKKKTAPPARKSAVSAAAAKKAAAKPPLAPAKRAAAKQEQAPLKRAAKKVANTVAASAAPARAPRARTTRVSVKATATREPAAKKVVRTVKKAVAAVAEAAEQGAAAAAATAAGRRKAAAAKPIAKTIVRVKAAVKRAVKGAPKAEAQPGPELRMPPRIPPEPIPVPIRPFDAGEAAAMQARRRFAEAGQDWWQASQTDRLVLLVKDPWWLFAYWNVTPATERKTQRQLRADEISGLRTVLRVYDITGLAESEWPGKIVKEVAFSQMARHWYVHTNAPGRVYLAEVGFLTRSGRFLSLVRSQPIGMPAVGPAGATDPEWQVSEEDYWKLFQAAVGSQTKEAAENWPQLFARSLSSESLAQSLAFLGLVSSWEQGSGAGGEAGKGRERAFRLWVDTELIVYGGTDPQARVTIQGQHVKLREDGTFSLRMHLPNGVHSIPVEAISPDGVEKRAITPIVSRQTTTHQSFLRSFSTAEAGV